MLQVIEMKSDFHEAYYNLSLICLDEENFAKAKEYAEKAVENQPSNEDYQKLLKSNYGLGICCLRLTASPFDN